MIRHSTNFFQFSFQVVMALVLIPITCSMTEATELLAHFEYECLRDNGCPHSANTATEANFSVEVYPGRVRFGNYLPGETEDITVPIDDFLVEFLTSGSFAAPEPLEFYSNMAGAGGSGRTVDKSNLQTGVDRAGPPVRVDAGYDVPLANGIDLEGTAVLTHLRFQLLDLEIFNSDILPGSTMRAHYRFEFLGQRVPEPSSVLLFAFGTALCTVLGRSSLWQT